MIQSNVLISWDMNNMPMFKGWKYSKIYQNWHYILNAEKTEELYHIENDPEETKNQVEKPRSARFT